MNKKGIGMGPAIALSVILLALLLMFTYFSLSLGKTSIIKTAQSNADYLEVNEVLMDLLNIKEGKLNLADLIVLNEYDKVESILSEKLTNFEFKVYDEFKNVVQSKPIYNLEKGELGVEEFEATKTIKNYYGEDLTIYLVIRK